MSESQIKVTVIIPCFNHGKSLDSAVNSVLSQTFQNFEIIIINDGSTDEKTNKILSSYNRPKTKVLEIPNQGPSVARNIGIQHASGEYILPLDADDTIENTYLEKAVKILDANKDVGIVCCDFKQIVNYIFFKRIYYGRVDYKFPEYLQFRSGHEFTVTSFFRKSDWEKVGGFNQNMIFGMEDYDFWISILELGRRVYHIPEFLFNYNMSPKSRDSSMTPVNQQDSYVTAFHNHEKLYLNNIETLLRHSVDLTSETKKVKAMNKRLILFMVISFAVILFILFFSFMYIGA